MTTDEKSIAHSKSTESLIVTLMCFTINYAYGYVHGRVHKTSQVHPDFRAGHGPSICYHLTTT